MSLPFWAQLLIGISVIGGLALFFGKVLSPPDYPSNEDASCECDRYAAYGVDEERQRYHRELVDAVLAGDGTAMYQLRQYMSRITNHPACWFALGDTSLKADFKAAWQVVEIAEKNEP